MKVALPLSSSDAQDLQTAYALLQAGDFARAVAAIAEMREGGARFPDALHLLGLVHKAQHRFVEAKQAFARALSLAPENLEIWNSYAGLLDEMGEGEAAISAYGHIAQQSPQSFDAWLNLGIAATQAGKFELAEQSLAHATNLSPNTASGWNAFGYLEQQRGEPAVAAPHFKRALTINPGDIPALHNLGVALRKLEQPKDALAQFDAAIAAGGTQGDTLCMKAHVLADLGRFDEAIAQYRKVIHSHPDHLDAQDTLAKLLPQLGLGNQALEGYRTALVAAPQSRALWSAAIKAAREVKDFDHLLAWSVEAERQFGALPEFQASRAFALESLGQAEAGRALLDTLVKANPESSPLHILLTHSLLKAGDAQQAESHALRATKLAPLDQSGWAYLTIIWRLLNDEREHWLADYDRMVMPIAVPAPDSYGGETAFLNQLNEAVTARHNMRAHPAEQSLRGGTQTRSNLFEANVPILHDLAHMIILSVEEALSLLPTDANHPFLGRNTHTMGYAGSWSVRLRDSGFHINHIHPSGWLSSAYYVSLPPEMLGEIGDPTAGALAFGVPDDALGISLQPRRIERPEPGKLVIFPSYMWHSTIPFRSEAPRLTIAFDAMPV